MNLTDNQFELASISLVVITWWLTLVIVDWMGAFIFAFGVFITSSIFYAWIKREELKTQPKKATKKVYL